MATRVIFGTVLALAISLSPHLAQTIPPQMINNSEEVTSAQGLVATALRTNPPAPCFKSSVIPETPPLMKIFPLEERFFVKPLAHPQPLSLLPRSNLQLHNLLPLSGRGHNQLNSNDLSDRLLTKAGSYLNTPYRRGGSLRTSYATDCSGFVQHIYRKFNVDLPRSSAEQAQVGKVAARSMDFTKLIPADLLFFSRTGRHIGHVGIYLGDGKMIHASNRRHGVIVTDLRQPYFEGTFVVAKRILKDKYHQ